MIDESDSLMRAPSGSPANGTSVPTGTAQRQPEPLVVSAFLAYKAREWHMCAIEGRARRSSRCEKAQVDPSVSQTGLPLIVVPPREFET